MGEEDSDESAPARKNPKRKTKETSKPEVALNSENEVDGALNDDDDSDDESGGILGILDGRALKTVT